MAWPNQLQRMVVAGGGTGGHLFVGMAVAEEMRRRHPQARITFVGTPRGIEVRAVPGRGFDLELLLVQPLRGGGASGVWRGAMALPGVMWTAWRLMRRLRPQIAVGVGGYAAGPAMVAARLYGCPCVILEQNAVAGITNRLLGRLVHRVIAAVPCHQFPPAKTWVLGNPVRAAFAAVRAVAPMRRSVDAPLRLLVVGGSQGAQALNEAMLALVPHLAAATFHVTIVHQTGAADAPRLTAAYAAAGMHAARVTAFIDDMAQAYAACDLVLCRAGASTLAELTVCGRPSILVPYPAAADDHQTANARVLQAAGAAVLLPQNALGADRLLKLLTSFAGAPEALFDMAQRARQLGRPEATRDIVDAIEAMVAHV